MVDFTYKANNILFEDKYVQWADVGIPAPGSDLLNQGTLYVAGTNSSGSLGLNDRTHRSSPVQVGSFNDWIALTNYGAGSISSAAIRTNGTLWVWGFNGFGDFSRLGLAFDTTHRSSPVQLGSLTNWRYLSTGCSAADSCFAIKTDGTLWAWGRNSNLGSLGLGDNLHRSSPVQVGSFTDWAQIVSNNDARLAIKTGGSLWGFGSSTNGIFGGNVNFSERIILSTPTQVGSLTNWKMVSIGTSHAAAIKTDGTLWAWGDNQYGKLGQNDTTHRNSPVQVGTLTNWSFISAGSQHNLAVKTDGTLWAWGDNNQGALGLGSTAPGEVSSPVQVGALTNWNKCYGGNQRYSFAIKTDGTLWSWGENNTFGQLGLGDRTNRSSPVQVGTATDWSIGVEGISSLLALRKRYNYT